MSCFDFEIWGTLEKKNETPVEGTFSAVSKPCISTKFSQNSDLPASRPRPGRGDGHPAAAGAPRHGRELPALRPAERHGPRGPRRGLREPHERPVRPRGQDEQAKCSSGLGTKFLIFLQHCQLSIFFGAGIFENGPQFATS